MTDNSASFGVPPRAGPPETHQQATAGSQRHFSLVKVLRWASFSRDRDVIWRMSAQIRRSNRDVSRAVNAIGFNLNDEFERRRGVMKYRKDIDGLRALAVVSVVLFHADLGPFGGGSSASTCFL